MQLQQEQVLTELSVGIAVTSHRVLPCSFTAKPADEQLQPGRPFCESHSPRLILSRWGLCGLEG